MKRSVIISNAAGVILAFTMVVSCQKSRCHTSEDCEQLNLHKINATESPYPGAKVWREPKWLEKKDGEVCINIHCIIINDIVCFSRYKSRTLEGNAS